jgi:hypothetical protein
LDLGSGREVLIAENWANSQGSYANFWGWPASVAALERPARRGDESRFSWAVIADKALASYQAIMTAGQRV